MTDRSWHGWLLVGAAALLVACGTDEPTGQQQLLTAAEQHALEDGSHAPPVAVLDKVFQVIVAPAVSASDKVTLVEDSDADQDVFTKIVGQDPATYRFIPPVTLDDPNGSAHANLEVNRTGSPVYRAQVPLVFDEGSWKIGKAVICPLLTAPSPMCQSTP